MGACRTGSMSEWQNVTFRGKHIGNHLAGPGVCNLRRANSFVLCQRVCDICLLCIELIVLN